MIRYLLLVTFVWCSLGVGQISNAEKVGQVLMVHFHGDAVNEEARYLIEELHIGGVIYYNWSNDLSDPAAVKKMSADLQQIAEKSGQALPLLIATDQEGGIVTRLKNGVTHFAGNMALAMTGQPDLAYECGRMMGQEMHSLGINLNLAPVVDVNCNPYNPVIGIRSFGAQPETVITFAEPFIKGLRSAGVGSCLKHFPGHGDVAVDSHLDLPVVNKTLQQLQEMELRPFEKLSPLADCVMTGHLMVPTLDPDHCATLSSKILKILKEDFKFEGPIITDSLVMEGFLRASFSTIDEGVIAALNAGCDLILLGGRQLHEGSPAFELKVEDIARIHRALVEAVASGRISQIRLDDAYRRVVALKERIKLQEHLRPKEMGLQMTRSMELSKRIAFQALKCEGIEALDLKNKNLLLVAPSLIKETLLLCDSSALSSKEFFFFKELNPTEEEREQIERLITEKTVVIAFSYNNWKNKEQQMLWQTLEKRAPLILVVVRDPIDQQSCTKAVAKILTFSPSQEALQAALEQVSLR